LVLQAAAIKKACESAAYPASQPWVAEARIAITMGNPVAGRTAGCGALLTYGVVCGVAADTAAGLPPPSPLAIELARAVTRTVMTAHGLIPCD
jgi:hypothetical protein